MCVGAKALVIMVFSFKLSIVDLYISELKPTVVSMLSTIFKSSQEFWGVSGTKWRAALKTLGQLFVGENVAWEKVTTN